MENRLSLEFKRNGNTMAFYDTNTGHQIGPEAGTRAAALMFVKRLFGFGEIDKNQVETLVHQIGAVFDALKTETGSEPLPKIKFVRSHHGKNGVFLLAETDDKFGPTMKNGIAAKNYVEKLVQDGSIGAEGVEEVTGQIDQVFQAIEGEASDWPQEFTFVQTKSGRRGIFLHNGEGAPQPAGPSLRSKTMTLKMLELNVAGNKMTSTNAAALRVQIDEVFQAIEAVNAGQPPQYTAIRPSGAYYVVIMSAAGRQVTDALDTKKMALETVDEMEQKGMTYDSTATALRTQIEGVFAAIDTEIQDLTANYAFTRVLTSNRGSFAMMSSGQHIGREHSKKSAALEALNEMRASGQLRDHEYYILLKQIDQVYTAIEAERTMKFVGCSCGKRHGKFLSAKSNELVPGTKDYTSIDEAVATAVGFYGDGKIDHREAGWLTEEIHEAFQNMTRRSRGGMPPELARLLAGLGGVEVVGMGRGGQ